MLRHRTTIHVCQSSIQIHVAEVAVQKCQADRSAVIDGLQLRKPLCGKAIQTADGNASPLVIRQTRRSRLLALQNKAFEQFPTHRLSVEPPLAKLAAQPSKRLRLLGVRHALGDSKKSQVLPKTHDRGNNLTAFSLLGHRAHKTAV